MFEHIVNRIFDVGMILFALQTLAMIVLVFVLLRKRGRVGPQEDDGREDDAPGCPVLDPSTPALGLFAHEEQTEGGVFLGRVCLTFPKVGGMTVQTYGAFRESYPNTPLVGVHTCPVTLNNLAGLGGRDTGEFWIRREGQQPEDAHGGIF